MHRKILFAILILSCAILLQIKCVAQGEMNNWNFGNTSAISFNTGTPISTTNSSLTSFEGSSSISDSAGNILFYSNGVTVWNKTGGQMNNGSGLSGNTDATTSATIIKQPGSSSLYYIFTIDMAAQSNGVCYSVVDMSLQSGFGSVISKSNFIYAPATEKLAATMHANGTDIWIVTHEWNTNNFRSNLLTSTGLNMTPVISGVGLIHQGATVNTNGYMRISLQGNKLAVAICHNINRFELFDFNNVTGVVSNPISFPIMPANIGAYGVEFSPDGSKLYGSYLDPAQIFQWDLNAGNSTAIVNSMQIVATNNIWYGAMRIGPDCKIYIACNDYYIGVINNPDSSGLACNVVNQAVYLGGNTCGIGLPNNISGLNCQNSMVAPIVAFASSDSNFCEKQCIDFFDISTNNPTSWQWFFSGADSTTSTLQNPTNICYNIYGNFNVTLIACNNAGCDTLTISNFINEFPNPVDSIYQSNDTLYSIPSLSYQWYEASSGLISGAVNQYFIPQQVGSFYCVVTDSIGCIASSNILSNTGIIEQDYSLFSISPNPGNGIYNLELKQPLAKSDLDLKIINSWGENIFAKSVVNFSNHQSFQINISNQPSGVYFLMLMINEKVVVRKLIVMK